MSVSNLFKQFLMASLITIMSLSARAQYHSDFQLVKGRDDKEIVYKGSLTFDDVLSVSDFNLKEASEQYKPNTEAINNLSAYLKDYDLVVFLGTWCEDSHRTIPQLYKILQLTAYPFEKLSLYGLDRDKKGKDNIEERYHVSLVPSIIVMKDGKEKGRITEVTDKSVEQDLWKIINQ